MSQSADPIGPVEARFRGAKGDKGERGDTGAARLSPKVSRALVFLFVLPSMIALIAVAGLVIQSRQYQASQRRDQAQQQQQGRLVEEKICATLAALAARKPPPGNPATNPSRAYLQGQYVTLNQLGPDLGCQPAKEK